MTHMEPFDTMQRQYERLQEQRDPGNQPEPIHDLPVDALESMADNRDTWRTRPID